MQTYFLNISKNLKISVIYVIVLVIQYCCVDTAKHVCEPCISRDYNECNLRNTNQNDKVGVKCHCIYYKMTCLVK